jgi:hypothetical protein
MKIQMNMNQKKNAIIVQIASQKVYVGPPTLLHPTMRTDNRPRRSTIGRFSSEREVASIVIRTLQ